MSDPFNLQRFLDAQTKVIDAVKSELANGQKRTHWMWFIFPQIAGLGNSPTSRHFAISGRQEAEAYLNHPVLGPRLRDCTSLVNRVNGRTAYQIFGDPDCMKFQSSMTLFDQATSGENIFREALAKYYDEQMDKSTLARLT